MRVLIVKTSSLGDIIHAFPVAAYLQDRCPGVLIDWVVEEPFSELVRSHPYVRSVYTIDTKKWRKGRGWSEIAAIRKQLKSESWDVVFDLQGNSKSAIFTHWANSSNKVGYSDRLVFEKLNLWVTTHKYDPPPEANVREENLYLVRSYLQDKSPFQNEEGVAKFHASEKSMILGSIARSGCAGPFCSDGGLPSGVGEEEQMQWGVKGRFYADVEFATPSKGVRLRVSDEEEKLVKHIHQNLPDQRKVMVCPGSAWPNKQIEQEALAGFLKKIPDTHFLLIWGNDSEKQTVDFLHREIPNSSVMDRLSIPVLQNLMDYVDEVIAMDSLPLHLAATTNVATYGIFGASSAQKYKPFGKKHRAFQGVCPYGRNFSRRCPVLRTCETGACIRSLKGDEIFEHYTQTTSTFTVSRTRETVHPASL